MAYKLLYVQQIIVAQIKNKKSLISIATFSLFISSNLRALKKV